MLFAEHSGLNACILVLGLAIATAAATVLLAHSSVHVGLRRMDIDGSNSLSSRRINARETQVSCDIDDVLASVAMEGKVLTCRTDDSLSCDLAARLSKRIQPVNIAAHDQSVGILIMVTADSVLTPPRKKNTAVQVLRHLMNTSAPPRPALILVLVDLRNKSIAAPGIWASRNRGRLRSLAGVIHDASGGVPVLVELVSRETCMGKHLMEHAFQCSDTNSLCDATKFTSPNTVAYSWGIARMAQFVRYTLHLDDDMVVRPVPTEAPAAGSKQRPTWVQTALSLMAANETILSMHLR